MTTAKLPSFDSKPITQKKDIALQTKNAITPKSVDTAEKHMALVRERGMDMADILTHDLLSTCPLFEGDFPAQAKKYQLVAEIAPLARAYTSKWNRTSEEPAAIYADFMSRARRQPFEEYAILENLSRQC